MNMFAKRVRFKADQQMLLTAWLLSYIQTFFLHLKHLFSFLQADMFSVGMMVFELYQPFSSYMEKDMNFKSIRNQQLPEAFTKHWPDQVLA